VPPGASPAAPQPLPSPGASPAPVASPAPPLQDTVTARTKSRRGSGRGRPIEGTQIIGILRCNHLAFKSNLST
jgi:hypothetical protein